MTHEVHGHENRVMGTDWDAPLQPKRSCSCLYIYIHTSFFASVFCSVIYLLSFSNSCFLLLIFLYLADGVEDVPLEE